VALSLIQLGTGGALCVYAAPLPDVSLGVPDATTAPRMPADTLAALGPAPCVVGVNARGAETPDEILVFAREKTGRPGLWWAALIGASRGCGKVRELYLAGATALALVLADGMHGQKPPTQVQLGYAQSIVALARTGAIVAVLLHTYIDPGPGITSTASMARLATGWALASPPQGQTVRRVQEPQGGASADPSAWRGELVVYSRGSGPADQAAHQEVMSLALPAALRDFVHPLVDLPERPVVTVSRWPATSPEPSPRGGVSDDPWSTLALSLNPDSAAPMAASPAQPAPVPGSTPSPSARLLLIGDSHAQGLGPPLKRLARAMGLPLESVGVQSTKIRDWLKGAELTDAIALADPTHTLVCLGANDMAQADPGAEGRRASELLANLIRNQTAVAWIGPPSEPRESPAFRAALAAACSAKGVRLFDSQALELPRRPGDAVHMTDEGYRTWADAIAAWVPFAALAAGAALPEPAPVKALGGGVPTNAAVAYSDAPALVTLRNQLNLGWPKRQKGGDGIRASDEHDATNPDSDHHRGDALDITADTANGPNLDELAKALLEDPRVHYVIWRRRIANNTPSVDGKYGWKVGEWRRYPTDYMVEHGSANVDPHEHHLHVSIDREKRGDTSPFLLAGVDLPGSRWEPTPATTAPASPAPASSAPAVRVPDAIVVEGMGQLPFEEYVARVVTGELGASREPQALAALAMAARTYALWMMQHEGLGTADKPMPNSTTKQVVAGVATRLATEAVKATRGGLILHRSRLVLASHVAGAIWPAGASSGRLGADASTTEKYIRYNEGLVGASVHPSPIANLKHEDNRGCLSQNGAIALAQRGLVWPEILRYFYGRDLEFTCAEPAGRRRPSSPRPPPPPPAAPRPSAPAPNGNDSLVLLAVGLATSRALG